MKNYSGLRIGRFTVGEQLRTNETVSVYLAKDESDKEAYEIGFLNTDFPRELLNGLKEFFDVKERPQEEKSGDSASSIRVISEYEGTLYFIRNLAEDEVPEDIEDTIEFPLLSKLR